MPGMGGPVNDNNPVIVSAFHRALAHQGLLAVGLLLVVLVAWNILRGIQLRRGPARTAGTAGTAHGANPPDGSPVEGSWPEAPARRLVRLAFGLLWVFDGILQGQASMPDGLVTQVIAPAAQGSPSWLVRLVDDGARVWSYHPVTAAAAAVWIQVGLGLWLIVAPRGNWSRLAGVAGAAWGLVIWIFGEALGGLLAPGVTWLFGSPGSALLYAVAGVLVALPESAWAGTRLGRRWCQVAGAVMLAYAGLEAWPGRGFWEGGRGSAAGPLASMVQQMAQVPQPGSTRAMVSWFAGVVDHHGFAVNAVAVVLMATVGVGFLSARPRWVRAALLVAGVLCLADWLLVEDLGFLGGVGTDPNSALPYLLLFMAGYLALDRPTALAQASVAAQAATPAATGWVQQLAQPTYALRLVATLAAVGVVLIGAAPMALAATRPNADPIVAAQFDGPVTSVDLPAPRFSLVNQTGHQVTSADLAGKVVAVTFLDPVCTNDCPVIAQEFRQADRLLGRRAGSAVMVAVDANPQFQSPAYLRAFDRQEHLDGLANWDFLTGTSAQLSSVWRQFGVEVTAMPGGAMVDHSDIAFVINPAGQIRYVLNTDPGPASQASESSFASTLAGYMDQALDRR
jgi:cytochrome oxidase Cu insertion factor (SCO1/SenC/PrrC family)